jgi:hypothetical protein
VNCRVSPFATLGVAGDTSIDTRVASVAVKVAAGHVAARRRHGSVPAMPSLRGRSSRRIAHVRHRGVR